MTNTTQIAEGLPESVKRIVVEALEQQDRWTREDTGLVFAAPKVDEPDSVEVTREILEAVADALEKQWGGSSSVARWLRSQAQENDDE